jgi:hypothetical protein
MAKDIQKMYDEPSEAEIIPATRKAANKYGHMFGSELIVLSPIHIKALLDGKMLAFGVDEYSAFVILDNQRKEPKK